MLEKKSRNTWESRQPCDAPPAEEHSDESIISTPSSNSKAEVSLAVQLECKEQCEEIISTLESMDVNKRLQTLCQITTCATELAFMKTGTRVVQKALEVAPPKVRQSLVGVLQPHVVKLYECPNGNHVLTRMIEVLPATSLGFVIQHILERGPTAVARHRFGCRVLERLIEHCSDADVDGVLRALTEDAEALWRHPYGNFVMQHLLEFGLPHRRAAVLRRVLNNMPQLAMHRTASHVVQKALDRCELEEQHSIIKTFLNSESPYSIEDIACSRYGSFVAEQICGLRLGVVSTVRQRLADAVSRLKEDAFGLRVAQKFHLVVTDASQIAGGEVAELSTY